MVHVYILFYFVSACLYKPAIMVGKKQKKLISVWKHRRRK